MPVHLGFFIASMALLAVAGFAKISRPVSTSTALRSAGLPSSHLTVRSLGLLELVVGVAGIGLGGPLLAMAGAALYLSFAVFVWYALRNDLPISSCGCLGATETPPSVIHIVANTFIAATLLVAVAYPLDPIDALTAAPLNESLLLVGFATITVYLLYALIAVMPRQRAARLEVPITLSPTPGSRS